MWKSPASYFGPYAVEAGGFAFALSQRFAHVWCDKWVVQLGLQLLDEGDFCCFQLVFRNGMLDGHGNVLVIFVVFGPPSDGQFCMHNLVVMYLLEFATAAGFPVLKVVLAASDVSEFRKILCRG